MAYQPESTKKTKDQAPPPKDIWFHQLSWVVLILIFAYSWSNMRSEPSLKLAYSEFKSELQKDNIEAIRIREERISGTFRTPYIPANQLKSSQLGQSYARFYTILPPIDDEYLMKAIESHQISFEAESSKPSFWLNLLAAMIPWVLLIVFFGYTSHVFRHSMNGKGMFSFSKSKAKHYSADNIKERFKDVAGLDNAKLDLKEVIEFLSHPEKYRKLGARIPKGILMMGPPGCGKTLLAKATAGEAGVPFFSVTGSEFIEMYVGVGASRVRDMFQSARKQSPALIFIDEIDSIGRVRGTGLGGGHDEREQTLNQILAEMDGFNSDEAVVVLAATNRPDTLDPALLRPGRFDRKLVLELPQNKARLEILSVHTREKPLDKDVDLQNIAESTVGLSGADLANLVNEAALHAARENKASIDQADFDFARDKVALGSESGEILTEPERKRIAYHECGHAILALLLPEVDPLKKISIIPRGRALGITEQAPQQDRHNFTAKFLKNHLCILLGGRCAEQLIFNELSSGAADDIKRANELARRMAAEWGMSTALSVMNMQQEETHPFLGKEMSLNRHFSEHYAKKLDDEVMKLLKEAEEKACETLKANRDKLERLASELLNQETLNRAQIDALFSK